MYSEEFMVEKNNGKGEGLLEDNEIEMLNSLCLYLQKHSIGETMRKKDIIIDIQKIKF